MSSLPVSGSLTGGPASPVAPTVSSVKARAAGLVGDSAREIYTNSALGDAFNSAWEELFDWMDLYQIPLVQKTAYTVLATGATSLTPEAAGIYDFGVLIRMMERQNLTTDSFSDVVEEDPLQVDQAQDLLLHTYLYENGIWLFCGATQDIQLKITYQMTGAPPGDDNLVLAYPQAMNYLAYRTAAIAGASHGLDPALVQSLDLDARGPQAKSVPPVVGGHLGRLLSILVRGIAVPIVPKSYRKRPQRIRLF